MESITALVILDDHNVRSWALRVISLIVGRLVDRKVRVYGVMDLGSLKPALTSVLHGVHINRQVGVAPLDFLISCLISRLTRVRKLVML